MAYIYTKSVFHHQSYEILKDMEPYMRDLTGIMETNVMGGADSVCTNANFLS
jgi:Arf-GAP/coiled-coil/ANK repeat/PH domain-containing protein